MIAVMKENEQVTTTAEPRWKAAGPPYLLTRDELLSELHKLGYQMSDRQIRDWVTDKIIPRPAHRLPPAATDGIARALYPAFMVAVIRDLVEKAHKGTRRKELQELASNLIPYWQERYGEEPEVRDATTHIPTQTLVLGPQPITASAHLTGSGSLTATAIVQPRIPRRLQLAVWGYAARFTERNSTCVTEASLTLRTEDGGEVHIPIRPAPPPRKRGD